MAVQLTPETLSALSKCLPPDLLLAQADEAVRRGDRPAAEVLIAQAYAAFDELALQFEPTN